MEADVRDPVRRGRDRRQDVRGARRRRVDRDVREPVALEERERVGALVLLEPRAVPELDERDERIEEVADAESSSFASADLTKRGWYWRRIPFSFPESSSGSSDARKSANARSWSASSCPVIVSCAFTWKTNSGGVRCAQRPVTSGSGRW